MESHVVFYRNIVEDLLLEAVSLCGRIHQDMRMHHQDMRGDLLPHQALLARLEHVVDKALCYTAFWSVSNLQAERELIFSAACTFQSYGTLLSGKAASRTDRNRNPLVKELAGVGSKLLDVAAALRAWMNR